MKKKLGQIFLKSRFILKKISSEIKKRKSSSTLLEIGAGTGEVTFYLNKLYQKLYLIEIDQQLFLKLKKRFKKFEKKIVFVLKNILELNLKDLLLKEITLDLFSSLPYYIAKRILRWIIEERIFLKSIFLILQKEVATSLFMRTTKKTFFFFIINNYFVIKGLFKIKKTFFSPIPKVDSFLIFLKKKKPIIDLPVVFFYKIKEIFFFSKRKTLFNNFILYLKRKELFFLNSKLVQEIKKQSFFLKRIEELTLKNFSLLFETRFKIQTKKE